MTKLGLEIPCPWILRVLTVSATYFVHKEEILYYIIYFVHEDETVYNTINLPRTVHKNHAQSNYTSSST